MADIFSYSIIISAVHSELLSLEMDYLINLIDGFRNLNFCSMILFLKTIMNFVIKYFLNLLFFYLAIIKFNQIHLIKMNF